MKMPALMRYTEEETYYARFALIYRTPDHDSARRLGSVYISR